MADDDTPPPTPGPAASASGFFRPPPSLNVDSGNIAENFKKWKRQMDIYLTISAKNVDDETKVGIILHCAGPRVIEIYDQIQWDNDSDKGNPVKVLEKLEAFCIPRQNEVLQTHRFWNCPAHEPFDSFLTELRHKAESCNFGNMVDRMIRDKIVFSSTGRLQELLLREDDLTLAKTIKTCRAYEQSNKQVKEIRDGLKAKDSVNKVTAGKQKSTRKPVLNDAKKIECHFCGYKHELRKEKCPAWNKTCDNCNGRNHFKSKCKKPKKVNQVEENETNGDNKESDEGAGWLAAVNSKRPPTKMVTATMRVNECDVRFQLDSGANVNTICKRYVKRNQVTKSSSQLVMWNGTKMNPLGEAELEVYNPCTKDTRKILFTVVENDLTCLLGLDTLRSMKLITVHRDRFIGKVAEAKPLGDLGEVHLEVDPSVKPRVLPCRNIPIALKDEVKTEIDNLVKRGLLIPVTEPTPWVSQMAVVKKPSGKLRICIDPQPLNEALLREHRKLTTVEDVLPMLSKAKTFSKLDVREAFWHVRLDKESSTLCTMITPFGRYRWSRLPFGLKVSSEIFARKLAEALDGLDGVLTIADDITVAGCGDTKAEADKDHDVKLEKLYERCDERNIILNDDKKEIKKPQIPFHGHLFTADGVKVDGAKVEAIRKMPSPTDIQGVKRLCGMVQYMAKFLPNLSNDMEPIRALTRKDTAFEWTSDCENAIKTVKNKLTQAPVLAYYDAKKELTLQVDSSRSGIGAALLQDGKPVEYASRTLTSAERNWAQIELELNAVVFGLERFDQYTYGREVIVNNDHKPLSSILKKPLSQVPKRLQALLMRVHRYDVTFVFMEGTKLVIADTLSRAHPEMMSDDRPRIMNVKYFGAIPDARVKEVAEATERDDILQKLKTVISDGWPKRKDDVPHDVRPYWDMRDVLSYDTKTGIIVKGEAMVIPKELRSDMKKRLHAAHMLYDSMMRRARGLIFWPGMAKEIQQIVDACEPCNEMKARNQKETLRQHPDGDEPFEKIACDYCEIKGRDYLITVDYYSNWIEIDYMSSTGTPKLIETLKRHFARFGIPKQIVTDPGPQFTSREFKNFLREWGIEYIEASPFHHSANGKAESAVKSAKYLMKKTLKDGNDPVKALLEQRNTPRQDTGLSPAEMMFGRKTRTFLPMRKTTEPSQEIKEKRQKRKDSVKRCYDRKARDMNKLNIGQRVFFEHREKRPWIKGQIEDILGDRTYKIRGDNGGLYRRNRVHMRPTVIENNTPDIDTPAVGTPAPVQNQPQNDADPPQLLNDPNPPNAEPPMPQLRPKRTIKEPAKFKDFVRY